MADKPKHDSLFKHTFGNPEHARGELRTLLPRELVARIDWPTLAFEPGSFVDEALGGRLADLLCSVELAGSRALIYVLFEHQSSVDVLMPYRLLRYLVRVWDGWLRDNPGASKLPAILPLVLYNGPAPWSASTELLDVFDLQPAFRSAVQEHVPRLRFLLDDLAEATDGEVRSRAELTAAAQLTQAALKTRLRGGNPVRFLMGWLDLLRALLENPSDLHDAVAIMYYVLDQSAESHREEAISFMQEHLGEAAAKAFESIGDSFRAEGELKLLRRVLDTIGCRLDPTVDEQLAAASSDLIEEIGVALVGVTDPATAREIVTRRLSTSDR